MALNLPRLVLRVPARRVVAQRHSSGGFYGSNNFDDFKKGMVQGVKTSESTTVTWKRIFYIASIPCILMTLYAAYREHEHHMHQPRKDHIEYPYLNVSCFGEQRLF